ncbi:MAG: post-segregation antitoxin CcdA [Rhodospirillaceae bacterium]|nr:post-segregation antitoxin CcdA [Rhodospirillaceae bacterium]MBT4486388.1 post-segregation antitoxin CcdA [Rhodospirillaceae bacterium]MBT5195746.1 post-segregation antitoxin CcdA [Rhodospirillaceae bacterium]MBT5896880.1 post-segregation antitoxin CcdA [Rhodospirillaceae bacterium]MBT6427863.1 post-segregation antitoxin CcdA [Rhodospirillaceae bacterium]
MTKSPRKPTNLSQDNLLLAEAGLRLEIARTRREIWKAENAGALESCNQWVEDRGVEGRGLPLERYRRF